MPQFFDIIKGTPYWVWILLVYLIVIGIQAARKNVVSLYRLPIMPLIFIIWSLYSMHNKYGITGIPFGLWLLFGILGIGIGYAITRTLKLSIDVKNKLIQSPGSLIPLFLSLTFFAIKYFLGVNYALYPFTQMQPFYYGLDSAASGTISGISLGRFISILRKYLQKVKAS